jgi:uncharacterized protein with FMN-binding domain
MPATTVFQKKRSTQKNSRGRRKAMKGSRVAFVVGASAAMLAAGWRVGNLPVASLALAIPAGGQVSTGPSPSPSAGTTTTTTTSTTTAAAAKPAAKPATTTAAKPATTTAPKPATTTAAKPAGGSGTYVGPSVPTAYGNMQVQLVIKAGKITQVQPLVIGYGDGTSQRINASAVPTLEQRVLSAQTYKVQYVSGASYTSQGFLASVQGAMAKAGI